MTGDEYTEILDLIAALWPNAKWELPTIKAAEELLLPLAFPEVRGIVIYLAKSGMAFAPTPGEVYFEVVGPPTGW